MSKEDLKFHIISKQAINSEDIADIKFWRQDKTKCTVILKKDLAGTSLGTCN